MPHNALPASASSESDQFCCHCLCLSRVQLCVTLTIARQAPLCVGFYMQEYWGNEGGGSSMPYFGESSQPRGRTQVSRIVGKLFTAEPPGKPRSAIFTHVSAHFYISFPCRSPQSIEWSSLSSTLRFSSVIYYTCQSQISRFVRPSPFPSGNHKFVFHICDSIS